MYVVRWQPATGLIEREVHFPHYGQAESCFINLLSEVRRESGGWIELWNGESRMLRFAGQEETSEGGAAAPPPPPGESSSQRGARRD